ncbi:MAG: hypothetical protein IJX76_04105 [Clostridia bacterium]|nr:hypothetical protein [Clostridia bacterium]
MKKVKKRYPQSVRHSLAKFRKYLLRLSLIGLLLWAGLSAVLAVTVFVAQPIYDAADIEEVKGILLQVETIQRTRKNTHFVLTLEDGRTFYVQNSDAKTYGLDALSVGDTVTVQYVRDSRYGAYLMIGVADGERGYFTPDETNAAIRTFRWQTVKISLILLPGLVGICSLIAAVGFWPREYFRYRRREKDRSRKSIMNEKTE